MGGPVTVAFRNRPTLGMTLVEIVVALAVSALLVTLLARTATQTTRGFQILSGAYADVARLATLRRIMHRDFQSMASASKMLILTNGFSMITSHSDLLAAPVQIKVSWLLEDDALIRMEEQEDMEYEHSQELFSPVGDYAFTAYRARTGEWLALDAIALAKQGEDCDGAGISALRFVLDSDGPNPATFLERIPDAALYD